MQRTPERCCWNPEKPRDRERGTEIKERDMPTIREAQSRGGMEKVCLIRKSETWSGRQKGERQTDRK